MGGTMDGMTRRSFLRLAAGATAALTLPGGSPSVHANQTGPKHYGVGFHNSGGANHDFTAMELLNPHVDMIRIGTRHLNSQEEGYPLGVSSHDPLIDFASQVYGWNRMLVIINDKNDNRRPTLDEGLHMLHQTIQAWPGIEWVQFYNEPSNFDGLHSPRVYAEHLFEAKRFVDALNVDRGPDSDLPKIKVVSGAFFGDAVPEQDLFLRFVKNNGGAEKFFDVIAVHDYTRNAAATAAYAAQRRRYGMRRIPIWVTETGIPKPNASNAFAQQENFYTNDMAAQWRAIDADYTGSLPQMVFQYQAFAGNTNGHSMLEYTGANTVRFQNPGLEAKIYSRTVGAEFQKAPPASPPSPPGPQTEVEELPRRPYGF